MSSTTPTIDVRSIPAQERHPLIFSTFRSLESGQSMELVNDHDPSPLHFQFQTQMPGRFSWDYLEAGPSTWRVSIAKLKSAHGDGQCCGSCGGA